MRNFATDIGGVDPWTVLERQFRILQVDYLDLSWPHVRDAAVTWVRSVWPIRAISVATCPRCPDTWAARHSSPHPTRVAAKKQVALRANPPPSSNAVFVIVWVKTPTREAFQAA
jgi:hypothetical protein